jgi:UDP-glucuronate decarboxylase
MLDQLRPAGPFSGKRPFTENQRQTRRGGSSRIRRVAVAGGAGFLGSHLCERLLASGCEVVCVDNFRTGYRGNLKHLRGHPRLEIMDHDICEPLSLEVEEIYNLACPASPPHYQDDPVATTRTSVLGTLALAELAKSRHSKLFLASTSEVYGDPEVHPQKESYRGSVNPIGPRSCYDEGKRCAESLMFDYWRSYGLQIRVARIFNTYGPGMHPDDGRVVSNFIVQALTGRDITIYGDGCQTRSFCYVDDLIEGMVRLMNAPDGVTGPLNLGNPDEFTIGELAHLVIEMTGSRSAIRLAPLPEDDPRQRRPDIGAAERMLDWRPAVSLREGLIPTIEYFDRLLTKPPAKKAASA